MISDDWEDQRLPVIISTVCEFQGLITCVCDRSADSHTLSEGLKIAEPFATKTSGNKMSSYSMPLIHGKPLAVS